MNVLFSPVTIGGVEVPNRVVMPPMTTRLADPEGYVTDALVANYEARALGGVGLITVEMGSPERVGRHRFRELGVYDDLFLPGLGRLVGALHDAGACSLRRGCGSGSTMVLGAAPDPTYGTSPGQKVTVIGDAARAGKARDAVDGAFRAALLIG